MTIQSIMNCGETNNSVHVQEPRFQKFDKVLYEEKLTATVSDSVFYGMCDGDYCHWYYVPVTCNKGQDTFITLVPECYLYSYD